MNMYASDKNFQTREATAILLLDEANIKQVSVKKKDNKPKYGTT